MLTIEGKNIQITRGDMLPLTISAGNDIDGNEYQFQIGDVVRFKIFEKGDVNTVFLEKDFSVEEATTELQIMLTSEEMKIEDLINSPKDYWYEIELNPDTEKTQTIIGYDVEDGAAILTLLPEGGDAE
ncbi:MAG: hypothetical protein ACI4U9_01590 [Clostridia bacterium]